MTRVSFFVPGIPQPGGSKRAFVTKGKDGKAKAVITEACKGSKEWRAAVAWSAKGAIPEPLTGPLEVSFKFILPRPKSHFCAAKAGSKLRQGAPTYHAVRPDLTKLIRSTEDALTGVAWHDDAQVARQSAEKTYGIAGCMIDIRRLPDRPDQEEWPDSEGKCLRCGHERKWHDDLLGCVKTGTEPDEWCDCGGFKSRPEE
jgi:Holliday junction resolvase RusA-like endonuclease